MLKLHTECMFASKDLKVISTFVSMFRSYLRSILFHPFCSIPFHITYLARFHDFQSKESSRVGRWGEEERQTSAHPFNRFML